jgi:chromosome segregation ATPase
LYDLKNSLETTLNTLNQIKPQNDEKGSKLNPLKKDVSELSSNFTSFQSDFKEQTLEIKNLKNLLDDTHSALDNLQKKLIHNDELDKKGEEGVLLAKVNTLSEEIDTLKNQQDEYQANLNSRMELISSSLSKICSSLEKTPGLKLKDSKNINALSAELAKNSSQIEVLKMIIEQQQRSTILRNIAIVGVALAIGYVMGKRRSTQ